LSSGDLLKREQAQRLYTKVVSLETQVRTLDESSVDDWQKLLTSIGRVLKDNGFIEEGVDKD
jgi:hypothetical protein